MGHSPGGCRAVADSGNHEHKTKLRVPQKQSVSMGATEPQT